MNSNTKYLCSNIETLMKYCLNKNDDLYKKIFLELSKHDFDFAAIFIKLNGLLLHRVRLNNESNNDFKEVHELKYPPSNNVSNYGRVNKPGQSMFYCSEHPQICGLELLHDYLLKNDIGYERLATYSEWEIKRELNLLILSIAPTNQEFSNGFTINNKFYDYIKYCSHIDREKYSNFYDFTKKFFSRNAKNENALYVVCSAISNYFTKKFPNIDGLIYPSVQGNTGYNIVLLPRTVDNKFIVPTPNVSMKKWIVSNKKSLEVNDYKNGYIKNDGILWNC